MSSGTLGISASFIHEVVEGSKVHEGYWVSLSIKGSWCHHKVSRVSGVFELMVSGDVHITSIVSVLES